MVFHFSFLFYFIFYFLFFSSLLLHNIAGHPSRNLLGGDIQRVILWSANQNRSCLDGSKPGYYLRSGYGSGKYKWIIYFEGGGWCFNEKECKNRMKLREGSSFNRPYPQGNSPNSSVRLGYGSGILDPFKQSNPDFYNWNVVSVMYCDGGAFAGSKGKYVAKKSVFYLSGAFNLNAILNDLISYRNFKTASRALLVGCSAGGQAVVYACDKVSKIIGIKKTKCLMDGGFFPDLPTINGRREFRGRARMAFDMHKMKGGVSQSCLRDHKKNPWKCFFAQHHAPYVKTPFLIVQSVRDPTGLRIVYTRTKFSKQFSKCVYSDDFNSCTLKQKRGLTKHFNQFRSLIFNAVKEGKNNGNNLNLFLMNNAKHCIAINSMWDKVSSCKHTNSGCVETGLTLKRVLRDWVSKA